MKILRRKSFAYAGNLTKKIVSDRDIAKHVAGEVAKSTKYIKEHPMKLELLRPAKKKTGWFSRKEE